MQYTHSHYVCLYYRKHFSRITELVAGAISYYLIQNNSLFSHLQPSEKPTKKLTRLLLLTWYHMPS